ncbi:MULTISPECIES: DMT family transporter [Clostridium]|uniref:DMT family transporter n=1 Tax=Clostridium TaxID=1485 RepID=UPI000983B5A8|nr:MULTISPECIES: DMT family transporter [Clostridium]AQR93842.1 4-amino-4-deoxy-L-arabinose-phosphoundecaprenol flippase subunit ArnE [Clostridium saccharoperbutylacetonicum]NSB29542.1 drug/metabolite transporter (DMT)-like permease [Clostridium saccharoperbutylacetonicum]
MSNTYFGGLVALITAICWAISPIAFEYAGKKVGSLSVNFIRLIVAFIFIGIYTYFSRGMFLPLDATMNNWIWLIISGIIGFVLGDFFLFEAYVQIGARLTMLIMATVPIISAIADYIIVGQSLTLTDIVGMLITMYGVAIVILVKNQDSNTIKFSKPLKGLFYALMGAVGQAVGLIFSKIGMENYDAFASTQIRTIAAIIGFSIIITYSKEWGNVFKTFRNIKVMKYITFGSFFGPFLGVSFSLLALQYIATGIASTIMSISRIIIIPASIMIFHEKVTKKEILGAVISIVGVSILFI